MSDPSQSELDFWEFVSCAICHLQFVSEPGVSPPVPFWLTECGHVICNNHLNADQSCAQCGSQSIQLVPLQQEMDPPMSDWFQSLPHVLEGVASAAKFQQEAMARQLRYYKVKFHQSNELINRIKREVAENKMLKKKIEQLMGEIEQLRGHLGFTHTSHQTGEEPSAVLNSNGKRQMTNQHRHSNDVRDRSTSSPRSIVTPLGPDRLTLPPGHQPPTFSEQRECEDGSTSQHRVPGNAQPRIHHRNQRPGSSRFVEQYAYAPPHTPQIHRSQAQRAPLRPFQRAGPIEEQEQAAPAMMPPPPTPSASRFKPAQGRPQLTVNQGRTIPARHGQVQDQNQNQPATRDRRKMDMGPPPTPVFQTSFNTTRPGNHGSASMSRPADAIPNAPLQSSHQISTNRVATSNSYGFPPPSANGHHRSFPSVPQTSGPQRFMAQTAAVSGFRAPSRPASSMPTPRMPFAPTKPS